MTDDAKGLKRLLVGINLAIQLSFCSLVFATPTNTPALSKEKDETRPWHFVFSAGGGVAVSDEVGHSQIVPIANPVVDQQYSYTPTKTTQTKGLFEVFVGAEKRVKPNWVLQLGLDYIQPGTYKVAGDLVQGADVQSEDRFAYAYKLKPKQLLLESKLLYHATTKFHPYALLGLGAAFNTADNFSTNVPPFLTFTRMYQSNNNSSFSYSVGVGVEMDMTQHIRLGIGYRFADFGTMNLGAARIDTTNVAGTLSQSHFQTNSALVQISFIH